MWIVGVIRPYIPDRFKEGYGLNQNCSRQNQRNGCRSNNHCRLWHSSLYLKLRIANELGLDIIITDHHSLGDESPPAMAVINPKRQEFPVSGKNAGRCRNCLQVGSSLVSGFWRGRAKTDVEQFLDLVAIGTVADLAPLQGENRRLVIDGLAVLNQLKRPGLAALANMSGLKRGSMSAESIGFGLGPRINAAGRLAHAYSAARLLAVNNEHSARQLARELE